MNERLVGVLGIVAALCVGTAIAWAGSSHGVSFAGWPVFLLCGIFAYAVQWLVFVHAWLTHSERLFDLNRRRTVLRCGKPMRCPVAIGPPSDTGCRLHPESS